MRRLGQAVAILAVFLLFSPDWVPLDPAIVRVVAGGLLAAGLTAAVLGSVLGSLPSKAVMDEVADESIPAPCVPLMEEIEALGFARLGPARRVHLAPGASIVPFWSAAHRCYATAFASDGAPAQAHYDFVTVFEPGDVGLTSAATPSAGVLPPARGSFLQIFPGAAPGDLLRRHIEGVEALGGAASLRPAACAESFDDLLAAALRRQREAFLRAPLFHTWMALWRVASRRVPAIGPVLEQRDTRDRLDALANPLAHADEALAVR
ncbi:MAG: hypothetical protein L6Q95_00685 [Planctomycetes bacterium]|nr:hypothetical protein [Planctomycetota bacterium]